MGVLYHCICTCTKVAGFSPKSTALGFVLCYLSLAFWCLCGLKCHVQCTCTVHVQLSWLSSELPIQIRARQASQPDIESELCMKNKAIHVHCTCVAK